MIIFGIKSITPYFFNKINYRSPLQYMPVGSRAGIIVEIGSEFYFMYSKQLGNDPMIDRPKVEMR